MAMLVVELYARGCKSQNLFACFLKDFFLHLLKWNDGKPTELRLIFIYKINFFKKEDNIQGGTLLKGGHCLRKYGNFTYT